MHPLLRRPAQLLLFLVAWLALGALLALLLTALRPHPIAEALLFALPLAVLYGFACLSAWWVCRSHPLRSDALGRALTGQFGAALQAAAVWLAAGALWGVAISRMGGSAPDRAAIVADALVLGALGVPLYLASAVAHYLLLAFEAAHAAERRALEAQVGAREAELRALRAQLNPHFLFNSLNSINALVGSDPEGARRMCEGLGDFMRRTLSLGGRPAVSLAEEIALVDRYLEIERVRFGPRLAVERAIEPAAEGCAVPPLLLQPLVENAVKHGVAGRVGGGTVRIAAQREGARLVVAVENPVDDDAPATAGERHGLENVRRRLAALGGGDARLEVSEGGGAFRVTLSLAAAPAPPAAAAAGAGGSHA
jgi:hypothetical protein